MQLSKRTFAAHVQAVFFLFDPFQVHALSRLSRQSHPAQGYVKSIGLRGAATGGAEKIQGS
jgi:hypothetical protein